MRAALLALYILLTGLPAAFAEEFSGLARLDLSQSRISDGWRKSVSLSLALSQGVPWRLFTLSDPDRLVLDFREIDWTGVRRDDLLHATGFTDLRFGTFRPGWSRMVADLAQPMKVEEAGMRVDPETGAARLSVLLEPVGRLAFEETSGAPYDPRWDLPPVADVARPRARPMQGRPLVVVLDPGHGGIDPGAQEDGIVESDLMLTLARELREALLRAGGFEVHLTRVTDEFVSLEQRVAIAHKAQGDIFISLHADALSFGQARGATLYTLADEASEAADAALAERHDRADVMAGVDLSGTDDVVASVLFDLARFETKPRSQALAKSLLTGIENATGSVNKRPLRSASFSVLKAADMPSVLIEAGFLSTASDRKNLTDPFWRAGFVAGVRDGIQAWALSDAAEADLRRK